MFSFNNQEATTVVIEGYSLYRMSNSLGLNIDYAKVLKFFREQTNLVRAIYVNEMDVSADYSPVKPLSDWLSYNGYTVVVNETYVLEDKGDKRKISTAADFMVVLQMIKAAEYSKHLVLFITANKYAPIVNYIKDKGVKVTVISSLIRDNLTMGIGDDLRRAVDTFIDIKDLKPYLLKDETPKLETKRAPITMG